MNDRERVAVVLRDVKTLPTLPTVAVRLLELGEDPNASIGDIAKLVETDVSLAARLLRLVNSSFFGVRREVTNVHHAVMILGTAQLRSLVLSTAASDLFGRYGSVGNFDREQFWKHSLAVAAASRYLAVRTRVVDPEVAFTAGLIHDMGKVVIDRYLHEDFLKIVKLMEEPGMTMRIAEYSTLGVCHAMIGQHIAIYWNLPEILREAIGHHHKPIDAPSYPKVAALIYAADALVRELQIGDGGGATPVPSESSICLSGLTMEGYEEAKNRLGESLEEQISLLGELGQDKAHSAHAH